MDFCISLPAYGCSTDQPKSWDRIQSAFPYTWPPVATLKHDKNYIDIFFVTDLFVYQSIFSSTTFSNLLLAKAEMTFEVAARLI